MNAAPFRLSCGDVARDNTTFAVATAYSRLSSPTRAELIAFLAGPRHPVAAHQVATVIVASTADADLVPLLARLLVLADGDEAMEAEAYQAGAVSGTAAANVDHPLRRSSDVTGR